MSKVKLITGGANGADFEFIKNAFEYDIPVDIYSFDKHHIASCYNKYLSDPLIDIYYKNSTEESEEFLNKAYKTLGRNIGSNAYMHNLLTRNYFIIKDSDIVYAVGNLNKNTGIVEGGTGWGVEFAKLLDRNLFLFDQLNNSWYYYDLNKFYILNKDEYIWNIQDACFDLKQHGCYELTVSGIGSRNITEQSKNAINDVFEFKRKITYEYYKCK